MSALRLIGALLFAVVLASSGWAQTGSIPDAFEPTTPPDSYEALRQKLETPVSAEFVETPFKDVIAFIADSINAQIEIDARSMEEAAMPIDTPITLRLKNVKASTLLKALLTKQMSRMDFVRRDGYIEVATDDALRRPPEPRVYLVRNLPGFNSETANVQAVIDLIQTTVEPETWEAQGGEGTIAQLDTILVIRQSPRVHDLIDQLLHSAREAIDQANKAKP